MRKTFWTLLSAVIVALSLVSCSKKIDEINAKIDSLDQRVTALEAKVNQDIASIQTAIAALQAKLTVTSVVTKDDGYVINFSDDTSATISNGVKGDKGDTPTVGITLQVIDGVATYVWTINGEVAKDANGNPYPVVGVQGEPGATPRLKFDGEHWYASYDYVDESNQGTWVAVDSDASGPAVTVDADSDPDYIILTISGTVVKLPKEKAFSLNIVYDGDLSSVGISLGQNLPIPYTVIGVDANDVVTVDVLSATPGLDAEVVATDAVSGKIVISAVSSTSGKVLAFADNGKGKSSIKVIKLEDGVLTSVADVDAQFTSTGGDVDLTVTTNVPYSIVIPQSAQDWISVVSTKATHTDSFVLSVAPNTTGGYRAATVTLVATVTGDVVEEYEIVQQPAYDGTPTSIGSLYDLPDGTDVYVENCSVVIASSTQAIITDGSYVMYVNALGLETGTVVKLTGVKKSDNADVAYLEVFSFEVNDQESSIEIPAHAMFMYAGWISSCYYTVFSADLEKDGDLYYLIAGDQTIVVFEEGPAGVDVDALVGKTVTIKGWGTTVEPDTDYDLVTLIPTEIKELVFAENHAWTLSYDGMVSGEPDYPEQISLEGTFADGEYVTITIFSEEDLDGDDPADFIPEAILAYSDNMMYTFTFYNYMGGYDFDFLFDYFCYGDSFSETFEEFEPGKYYILAIGLDQDGGLTGKYAWQEFERKDSHIKAAYEDFLGDWTFVNSANVYEYWTLTEKVPGESYYVSGLCNMAVTDLGGGELPEAIYDEEKGNVSISNQHIGDEWEYSSYVLQDKFVAVWWGSSGYQSNEDYMEDNTTIFTMSFLEGDLYEIKGSVDDWDYAIEGFAFFAEDTGGAGDKYYLDDGTSLSGGKLYKGIVEPEPLPQDPDVPVVFFEDFEAETNLAGWSFFDADGDGYNWAYNNSADENAGNLTTHSGTGVIFSQSYDNSVGALTPDNWAFTPAISFTSGNYLSFWVVAQDPSYSGEHYAVYISADAPTASNLDSATKLLENTFPEGSPVQTMASGTRTLQRYVIEIPAAYAGGTGYIGFRHFNCTDMFYLNIDDVVVTEGYPVATNPAPKKPVVKKQQKQSSSKLQIVTERMTREEAKAANKSNNVAQKVARHSARIRVMAGELRK